jgi:hypothetical protein
LSLREGQWDQYALPIELTLHENRSSLPTAANSAYNKSSSRMNLELPEPPATIDCSPEIYSEVGIDGDSGLYDDIGANHMHYALIPEAASNAESDSRNVSHDMILPYETPRLSKCIDETQKQSGEAYPLPQTPTNETQMSPVGIYSQVGESIQDLEVKQGTYYADMQGSRTASQLSVCSRRSSSGSVPLLQLSKPLGHEMEDNPTYNSAWSLLGENEKQLLGHEMEDNPMYNSAWSLLGENEKQGPEEDTYTDPDATFHGDSQQTIYETVYQ